MGRESNHNNAENYHEKQRAETCANIERAILHLRVIGVRVTKRSIAEEVGCHENTLRLPYVKSFLTAFEEFQPKQNTPATMSVDEAMQRISQLKDALAHSRNRNKNLTAELARLRAERDNYEMKYRRLLGKYQIDVGKMKTGF